MEEKYFSSTLFLYQFSSIYFSLFQRNTSLLFSALLRNRKRMVLKWGTKRKKWKGTEEKKRGKKKERMGKEGRQGKR